MKPPEKPLPALNVFKTSHTPGGFRYEFAVHFARCPAIRLNDDADMVGDCTCMGTYRMIRPLIPPGDCA
jgi:hypothetical protein